MSGAAGGFVAGSIVAKLLLDKSGWDNSIKAIAKDESKITGSMGKIGKSVAQVGVMAAAAASAATVALLAMVHQTARAGEEFYDLSLRTGVSAEILSGLKLAADKSGTSLEGLALGLRFLGRNMVGVEDDVKKSVGAFADLGVKVKDDTGAFRPMADVLLEVSDKFAGMTNGAEKTALAIKLFGRSGTELIPMLNMGSAALLEQMDLAEKLGIVFTEKTAKAADRYMDSLVDLKAGITGIRNTIANAFIPILTTMSEAGTRALVAIREKVNELAESGRLREWAVSTATVFIQSFKLMAKAVEGLVILMNALPGFLLSAKSGFENFVADLSMYVAEHTEGTGRLADETRSYYVGMADAAREAAGETGKQADKYLEAAATTVDAFETIFTELDKLQASLGKTGETGKLAFTKIGGVTQMTADEVNKSVQQMLDDPEFGLWRLEEIPIEFDFTALDAAAQKIWEIPEALDPILAAANSALDAHKAKVLEQSETYRMLINQVNADILNNFTSIMDGSKTMAAAFEDSVTTMVAALGKLVLAEMMFGKKSILGAQMQSVAHYIASLFKTLPWFIAIPMAAGAFALVSRLFKGLMKFKEGGVFKEPTIAEVGHGTEYVLPEKKLINIVRDAILAPRFAMAPLMAPAMAGGGASIVWNQNAPLISTTGISRRDLDAAGEQLVEILNRQLSRVSRSL